jgi:hypothetical protein
MKHLKKFNELSSNNDVLSKSILREGFESLIKRSHIVSEQVKNNLDKFIESFDIEKFESKFGKIKEFLGAGVFGAVFSLSNEKVFKITFDFHEAPFLYEYCFLKKTPGLVKVDGVWNIKFGDTNAYLILRSPVEVLEFIDFSKNEDAVEMAEKAMYDISPNWRGTHNGNYAFQDGEVVLYDGFCKKAAVDGTKVPLLDL